MRFGINRSSMRWAACSLASMFVLGFASLVYAERPTAAQLLPADTLAYFRMAHVPELQKKFQDTALGKISADPQIKPLVTHLYGSATEAFGRIQDQVGASLGDLLKIPQGEIAIAVVPPKEGAPAVVVLFDTGNQAATARKMIEKGEAALEQQQGVAKSSEQHGGTTITTYNVNSGRDTIAWCEREGTYVLANNMEVLKALLDRWDGKEEKEKKDKEHKLLSQNEKFAAVMKRCQASGDDKAQVTWFVDPLAIVRISSRGNFTAQAVLASFPALGLDGLQAIGGSAVVGTEDFDIVLHAHLLLDNPRRGVIEMLALTGGDTSPEPWVPADAASYMTLNWDVHQTWTSLEKVYNSFRGEGALSKDAKANVSQEIGADLETEIIPAFTGRITFLTWIEKPARLNGRTNLMALKLKDSKAFAATLDKLAAKYNDNLETKSYAGVTYRRVKQGVAPPRRQARQTSTADEEVQDDPARDPRLVAETHPCFALFDDYLLMADRESVLEHCIAAKSDSGHGLAQELDFKLIASKIRRQPGGDQPGMLLFDRPEEGLRMLYDLATGDAVRGRLTREAERNDFFKTIDSALKENPLPPFAVIAKYLAPSGGMIVSDETGFHYSSFTLRRK